MPHALATLRRLLRPPPAAWPSPRATRTRARQSVLAGVAFVVLLAVGLNVALDTVKPEWRDPEYGHRLKQLKPLAAQGRPVVVVLGSSRAQMGLSPEHLGDGPVVYNLSQAGCGPVHELLNLRRLLADGVRPDALLVEILPPVLAGDSPAEQTFTSPERLSLADVTCLEPYCDDPSALWQAWATRRVAPWHSLRLNLLCNWGGGSLLPWQARQDFMWKQMKPGGWLPYFHAEVSAAKRADGLAQARAQYVPYFADYRVAPRPAQAYRDLLDVCRAHGVRVAFFVMPESPTFAAWYPPAARRALADYYAGLGVPVFDASGWLPDDGLFADGHHLMRHGAEQFSARFGRECLAPWLAR